MSTTILLAGATGMVGGHALKLALENDQITKVITYGRKATGAQSDKLLEITSKDFLDFPQALLDELPAVDHIVFCLGVYTGAVNRELFRSITVDMPVELGRLFSEANKQGKFSLLSGQGADRKEKSRMMFAKDKGAAENALTALFPEKFHTFRPGYIYPVEPRDEPNLSYRISRKLYPLLKAMGTNMSITSHQLGEALLSSALRAPKQEILENRDIIEYLQS